MDSKLVDPKNTALLVIDIQKGYCSPKGKMAKLGYDGCHFGDFVSEIKSFVRKARDAGLTIIFTRMIEDKKHMSQNARIKMESDNHPDVISPETSDFEYFKIKPIKGDHEIIKKSYDAFTNPKLDGLMKRRRIKNIIVVGVHTQVCVDMTVKSGYSKGYNIVIPLDLVTTDDKRKRQEKTIIEIWKDMFAHVTSSKEILDKW